VKDKVALVTGGGRGIGRAIVLRLAKDGFALCVNSLHKETVESVVEEVRQMGRPALGIPGDVAKQRDVKRMFEDAVGEFGRLDVLVTNAGVTQVNTLDELNEEIWEKTLAINAKGTYLCMLEASRLMIKQKSGKIITIGSDFSIEGARYHVCYSASKFAVRGLTQAFAKELAPSVFGMKRGEAFEKFTKDLVLLPKPGRPEYIAPVVSFLASEDADYITAATIPVGGGSMIF